MSRFSPKVLYNFTMWYVDIIKNHVGIGTFLTEIYEYLVGGELNNGEPMVVRKKNWL